MKTPMLRRSRHRLAYYAKTGASRRGCALSLRRANLYAARGAFAHASELWLVQGLPPALVARAIPFVTVYSGRPEINVFDAPPELIAALPGMTPARLNDFLDQRETAAADKDSLSRLLGPDQPGATAEGSNGLSRAGPALLSTMAGQRNRKRLSF